MLARVEPSPDASLGDGGSAARQPLPIKCSALAPTNYGNMKLPGRPPSELPPTVNVYLPGSVFHW